MSEEGEEEESSEAESEGEGDGDVEESPLDFHDPLAAVGDEMRDALASMNREAEAMWGKVRSAFGGAPEEEPSAEGKADASM